jgi:hypothetical protein
MRSLPTGTVTLFTDVEGSTRLTDEGCVGDDVHFAARVASFGHGGQVILSAATAALLAPSRPPRSCGRSSESPRNPWSEA